MLNSQIILIVEKKKVKNDNNVHLKCFPGKDEIQLILKIVKYNQQIKQLLES